MSIKGGDNFDLLPDRTARDMETILGIDRKRCGNCLRGHATGAPAGWKRCGFLERIVRDDETCDKHIGR